MILKYVSGTNEEFILNEKYEVNVKSCQPYFTEWNLVGDDALYGVTPTFLSKNPIELPIELKFRGSINEMNHNLEAFFEMCEKDILAFNEDKLTKGKLYLGKNIEENGNTKFVGGYLSGWFLKRETTPVKEWYGYSQSITFVAPKPFWIYPLTKEFYPTSREGETYEYLDYDYNYNYDYSYDVSGVRIWNVNHYAKSDFVLTIYGYCENPRILINGHAYQIYTTLESNEYLTVNSYDGTVIKHLASGDEINIFDLRLKGSNIFEKMPSGLITATWSGAFGFTLTLLTERSEPKWEMA